MNYMCDFLIRLKHFFFKILKLIPWKIIATYLILPIIAGIFASLIWSITLRKNPELLEHFKPSKPTTTCEIIGEIEEIGNAEITTWEMNIIFEHPKKSIFIYFDSDRVLSGKNSVSSTPQLDPERKERIVDKNKEVVGVVLHTQNLKIKNFKIRLNIKSYTNTTRIGCTGFKFQYY